jgi:hypothetical protein
MGINNGTPSGGQTVCGAIAVHNDQWFGFVAGTPNLSIDIITSNCQNGDGLQVAFFEGCPPEDAIVCNPGCGGCGNQTFNLSYGSFNVGQTYYLFLDGWSGDVCNFEIAIVDGTITPGPPDAPTQPQGPSPVCPGATAVYTTTPSTNAGSYTWTAPPGSSINGGGAVANIVAPDGETVTITFGNVGGNVCVRAANACNPPTPNACLNVPVQPIPPTILPRVNVCTEDLPYELPWGPTVNQSGTYQVTYDSYLGCDSVVRLPVTVVPPKFTNLPPLTVCESGSVTVCGEIYNDPGTYSITCESYQGCDSVISFSLQVLNPLAEIIGGGSITCANPTLTLNSAPSGGTKFWRNITNPSNPLFLGTGNTVVVNQPGVYQLINTINSGGVSCSDTTDITIPGNLTPPTLSVTGGTIGCINTTVTLGSSSNASNPAYSWAGPNGFASTLSNPVVSVTGIYALTITNPADGCTNTGTATVNANNTPPVVGATGNTITCTNPTVVINATSNVGNSGFSWSGPGGFTSTLPSPTVGVTGNYVVVVTNLTNSCTASATATVNDDLALPGAIASVAGTITCPTPTVTLNGNSPTNNVTYNWGGPNSYSASGQNPTAASSGTYTVTVTGANGCTSTANTNVNGNTLIPDLSATGGILTCGMPSINIGANSNTNNVSYAWTGPGAFNSSVQNPLVSVVGTYTVTVTASNDCTNTATAVATGNFTAPDASASGGIITCASSTTLISGSSTTPNVTFAWSGPGNFSSNLPAVAVNTVGTYTLTTIATNGCTATATAVVLPDASIPNASATGGTINCLVNAITLNGGSTSAGVVLGWTGPGGFVTGTEDPTVTVPGTYVLQVTNPATGCSAQATAVVDLDVDAPGASASGSTLTCTLPTITLNGGATANSVSWLWTGPAAFGTSNLQNPTTNEGGTYNLLVTGLNGCTSTATVVIPVDQTEPVLSTTSGTLTCAIPSFAVTASASLPVTYLWSGPFGFNADIANPVVSIPGDYTVTVTAANGCTDTELVQVTQNITPPGGSATGGTLSCSSPQIAISASSAANNVQFSWDGPAGFMAGSPSPIVSQSGFYGVTITGQNGCTSIATAEVLIDTAKAIVQSSPSEILTCAVTAVNLNTDAFSTSQVTGYVWGGPNGFTSNLEDPTVILPGTYRVTVTLDNGCTSTGSALVDVNVNQPDLSATGGTVSCSITTLSLDGSSATPGATYVWGGPNNFSSNLEDPTITDAGIYTVVVTGPNGCTRQGNAEVLADTAPPGASAASSNVLTCTQPTSGLQATSPTGGSTFAWTGPNAFTSSVENPSVNTPGVYQVEATGPNGCTSTTTINVTQNIAPPPLSVLTDTLTCTSPSGKIIANSTASGLTYLWSGPNGFSSASGSPTVTESGNYLLIATGLNGCTSTGNAEVVDDQLPPAVVVFGGGVVTCILPEAPIVGQIFTPGAQGTWNGPGGFKSTQLDTVVTVGGEYTLTVVGLNGCINTESITITENNLPPASVESTAGQINCNTPVVTLTGSSITPNVTYLWTGPNGYSAANPVAANITNPGTYTLVVTDPGNGCTETTAAVVLSNFLTPTINVVTDVITCSKPKVAFTTTVTPANSTYSWTGPNGFTSTAKNPQNITEPGNYTLVAKSVSSGCTASFTLIVQKNVTPPDLALTGDTITCFTTSGTILANSQTSGVTYSWVGPGTFTATNQNPVVTLVGDYTVTVTAPNGCTTVGTTTVSPDVNAPVVALTGGTLTCTQPSLQLTASSNLPVTWLWSGPNGFTSTLANPNTAVPGTYNCVATAQNGCSVTSAVVVADDTKGPVTAVPVVQKLTCNVTQITLNVEITGAGSFSYNWQGGTILSGANAQTVVVSQAATYFVTVTNNLNGCTSTNQATVDVEDDTPNGALINAQDITCYGLNNGKIAIGNVQGGTPPYLFSLDNKPFNTGSTFTALTPGPHDLVIQDINGCEFETVVTLSEPDSLLVNLGEDLTIHLGETIDLSIADVTNDPGRVDILTVDPASLFPGGINSSVTLTPLYSLRYTVTAIDTNGCKASDSRLVIVNKERLVFIPNIFDPESDFNNLFMIFGVEPFEVENIEVFQVFDRWGSIVHEYRNFMPNNPSSGWDGRIKGEKATPAVFTYYAKIKFIDGITEIFKGDVLLKR